MNIVIFYLRNRLQQGTDTSRHLNNIYGRNTSLQTIWNRLREVKHKCRRSRRCLILTRRHIVDQFRWARIYCFSRAPMSTQIEDVWDLVKRRVCARPKRQNLRELGRDVTEVWYSIPKYFLQRYVASMRQRC